MLNLMSKLFNSLKNDGMLKTYDKIIYLSPSQRTERKFRKILLNSSNREKFNWIYAHNYWGSSESLSGSGSSLHYTENLRRELPHLINLFSISVIFDAPCGDLNWMSSLLPLINIEYIGGDIVGKNISNLNKKYANQRTKFIELDIINNEFPKADLMICRDCLFHFSYEDTKSVLEKFLKSEIKYFLTTTHKPTLGRHFENKNIITGDFRYINLFSSPYNFPPATLYTIDDWVAPDQERIMCLWSRDQILIAMSKFGTVP